MAMAPVTPTMFPVPTVAASAVVTACMGVTLPAPARFFACFPKHLPMVLRMAYPKWVNWKKPSRTERYRPHPTIRTSMGTPQTTPLTMPLISLIFSAKLILDASLLKIRCSRPTRAIERSMWGYL